MNTLTCTLICTNQNKCTHTHINTHTHSHIQMRTHIHEHTLTHICKHKHSCKQIIIGHSVIAHIHIRTPCTLKNNIPVWPKVYMTWITSRHITVLHCTGLAIRLDTLRIKPEMWMLGKTNIIRARYTDLWFMRYGNNASYVKKFSKEWIFGGYRVIGDLERI
jgi:hypothetical protein